MRVTPLMVFYGAFAAGAVSAGRAGGRVVVTVIDTCIGIPADALPCIFDMFSQVDRSVERHSGGLGIGLALVKGLVEMHGGDGGRGERRRGPGLDVHRLAARVTSSGFRPRIRSSITGRIARFLASH
jgi:K+-sensing histidine kinase KdpD